MPFTEVCSARKSPPRSVSLTWMSGLSPSPLVFTAPLMPPCAHTEWDRFTGTMESRSTCCPASASLMAVISPARPPPTTVNRASAIVRMLLREPHLEEDVQRRRGEGGKQHPGHRSHPPLRHPPGGDAPGPGEAVQAVGEVVDGEEGAEQVEREDVRARAGRHLLHQRGVAQVRGHVVVRDQ